MKKRLLPVFVFLLIFSTSLVAQNTPDSQISSKAKFYKNYLYSFTFEIPSDWIELKNEDSKIYAQIGKEFLKPNKIGETQLEKSTELTEILLNISKLPPGTPGNATLICAVEINQTPDATIQQSALATENAFVKNFGYTIETSAKKTELGAESFMMIKIKKPITKETTLYQSIYLKKIDKQILQFVLSYTQPNDGELMEKFLKTLKFNVDQM